MRVLCIDKKNTFKSTLLHPKDLAYKKAIQAELKNVYGLSCKIDDLKSIAGPIETKRIIRTLKPFQYKAGDEFRANFHIHTNASDGSLTTTDFLEQCIDWANSVFKCKKINDELPPFSAAITDHDSVKSTKEAILKIAENPDKYKNFKFISGCEFMFFDGYKHPHPGYEAVGLGFNPFDSSIAELTLGLHISHNRTKDIPKIINAGGILSWAHPIITPDKINDDFFSFLKSKGINYVEGNYQYQNANSEYIKTLKEKLQSFIDKYKMISTGGNDSHIKSIFGMPNQKVW